LMGFENGARGILSSSYVSPKTFYLRLYGTEANLTYETDMSIWPQADRMDAATTLILQSTMERRPVVFAHRNMLTEELDEFARCIGGKAKPETDANAALNALEVIRGALTAHELGQTYIMER
jgi:predicted dehydrogenase